MLVSIPMQDRGSTPLTSTIKESLMHYGESILSGEVIRAGKMMLIMEDTQLQIAARRPLGRDKKKNDKNLKKECQTN